MPEQISKYPDVTLGVLKGAGARCGEGVAQKILTQCPAERFCSLPTGEICVFGIGEIPQMTQITAQELAQVVSPIGKQGAEVSAPTWGMEAIMFGAIFVAGLALGRYWQKLRARSSRSQQ
ncbi:MAG: hypothetical protein ACREXR_04620 [Gammaproteobacteria bacterium]